IVPVLATLIGSIVTLAFLGVWQYALFLAIYAVVFGIIIVLGSRFLADRNRNEAAMSTKSSGFLADMVTNVNTVKAFGREDEEYKGATHVISNWHNASSHLKWGVLRATSVFSSMTALGATAALIFATLGAEYGIVSVGVVYLMFVYSLNVNRQLWEMNHIMRMYNRVIGDAHEITEILHTAFDLVDHSKKKLSARRGEIVFDSVTFSHDNGKGEQVFTDFSLVIPAGQRVGVVGHSGSGKTTLTRILLRFSDIDSSKILIDGQDIHDVTQKSLHESIAYVAQEPMLFHRSLQENIAYGKQDATPVQIIEAAKKAHA